MVKLRDVLALDDVPDSYPTRFKTGGGDEVCRAFIELGVHQHHIKIFDVIDFDLRSVTDIKFPDACDHITGARDEPVALTVPVDRTHVGRDLCKMRALDVRQGGERCKVVEVVASEVPNISHIVTSCCDKKALLWIELSKEDVVSVLVFRVDSEQIDSDLRVVLQRQDFGVRLGTRLHLLHLLHLGELHLVKHRDLALVVDVAGGHHHRVRVRQLAFEELGIAALWLMLAVLACLACCLAHALGHGLVHEVLRLAHCLWEVGHHAEVGREACGVELHTLWSYLKTILSQLSHAWVLENT